MLEMGSDEISTTVEELFVPNTVPFGMCKVWIRVFSDCIEGIRAQYREWSVLRYLTNCDYACPRKDKAHLVPAIKNVLIVVREVRYFVDREIGFADSDYRRIVVCEQCALESTEENPANPYSVPKQQLERLSPRRELELQSASEEI